MTKRCVKEKVCGKDGVCKNVCEKVLCDKDGVCVCDKDCVCDKGV